MCVRVFIYTVNALTPNTCLPRTSFATNSTISIIAIKTNCNGDVFPSTTPNDINTAADAKSAVNKL